MSAARLAHLAMLPLFFAALACGNSSSSSGAAADSGATSSGAKAFGGKLRAIVRSTGRPGQIVVTATSSGLNTGSVTVNAM